MMIELIIRHPKLNYCGARAYKALGNGNRVCYRINVAPVIRQTLLHDDDPAIAASWLLTLLQGSGCTTARIAAIH